MNEHGYQTKVPPTSHDHDTFAGLLLGFTIGLIVGSIGMALVLV